jgi:2-keto-4-pentenoate hydratase
MGPVWDDDRVRGGMRSQLAERARRLKAGERPIGWKVAFGAPPALETFGIEGPVVGFLTERSLIPVGGTCSLAGWTKPALEPEIAVHMARDLGPGADRAEAAAAIGELGPAIELADVDQPLDNLEAIVSTNIFHRAVVLGGAPTRRMGSSITDLEVEIRGNQAVVAKTDEPTALVGDILDLIAHVAAYLGAFGERLRSGDVVITGSTVPLIWPEPHQDVEFILRPLGAVSVRLVS